MKIEVNLCEATGEVFVGLSNSSKKRIAKCLGVLERDQAGEPKRLILDRKVLSDSEVSRIENSRWQASGSFVTELHRV